MCIADDNKKTVAVAPAAKTTKSNSSNNNKTMSQPSNKKSSLRLLWSLDSFSQEEFGDNDRPDLFSCAVTCVLFIAFLCCTEQLVRWGLAQVQGSLPVLEKEINRQILARHIGVDTLSCMIVFVLGWKARHISQAVLDRFTFLIPGRKVSKSHNNSLAAAGHEARLYTYHPESFRIALLFFAYQIKNLYDTIVWHDGPEFIFHHVFSIITAAGVMQPGCGHYYSLFFFGLSELSTAVLCMLANFDDEHGVPGLGDALPMAKVILGVTFVILFIVCRCTLWPVYSYYFCRDVLQALRDRREATSSGSRQQKSSLNPRTHVRTPWLYFFLISLSGISVLQVAWLGQIFILAKQEFEKLGFL